MTPSAPPPLPGSTEKSALQKKLEDPSRIKRLTIFQTVLTYGAVLYGLLHASDNPRNQAIFGDIAVRLGWPLWLSITAIVTLVFIPFPFAVWHMNKIYFRGVADGMRSPIGGPIRALFTVPNRHPDLRVSRWIVILLFIVDIALVFTYEFVGDARANERMEKTSQGPSDSGDSSH